MQGKHAGSSQRKRGSKRQPADPQTVPLPLSHWHTLNASCPKLRNSPHIGALRTISGQGGREASNRSAACVNEKLVRNQQAMHAQRPR